MQRIVGLIVFFAFGAFAQDLQTILERARTKNKDGNRVVEIEAAGINKHEDSMSQTTGLSKPADSSDAQTEATSGVVVDRSPASAPSVYNKLEFKKDPTVQTTSNPAAPVNGEARCVPHFLPGKRGQVNGFKCFEVQSNRAMAEAGLQEGDVILSVDDQRLVSTDDVVRTYSKLGAKSYSQIVVLRDGKQLVLSR